MKLTPHEILTYLGINVPQDGLDINSHDLYLHATLLRLLGQQMRVDAIPGTELAELLVGLHGVHFGPGAVVPAPTAESTEKLCASLRVIQKSLGMAVE